MARVTLVVPPAATRVWRSPLVLLARREEGAAQSTIEGRRVGSGVDRERRHIGPVTAFHHMIVEVPGRPGQEAAHDLQCGMVRICSPHRTQLRSVVNEQTHMGQVQRVLPNGLVAHRALHGEPRHLHPEHRGAHDAHDLDTSALSLKAVLTTYTLALAVFIPVSGWVADRFGTRRVVPRGGSALHYRVVVLRTVAEPACAGGVALPAGVSAGP